MNFFRRLFGTRSKPPEDAAGLYEGVYKVVDQHRSRMAQLGRKEDEYWERKKTQLQTERETQSSLQTPSSPAAQGLIDEKNRSRAEDLARIAEWHFKCDRFDEARKNYERAALLTSADDNLSKQYQDKANKVGRKTK